MASTSGYDLTNFASFDATNEFDKAIMLWKADISQLENDLCSKEKMEARILDLYRNNDLMRGLVEKQVDTLVGDRVALQALPDHEGLGVDRAEAMAWQKLVENEFHRYVDSPENWISADRSMDFTQLCRQAARSEIFTGEIFSSREWRRSPLGYSTCINLFSSHRVKTANAKKIDGKVFHGIEFDKFGAATAYHVEQAKANQKRSFGRKEIKRFAKYNSFGWLQMFHIYEPMLPEYPRGISRLASVLKKMKQLERYQEADLDKNIIAASYVLAVTSDEDPESIADMLSGANTHAASSAFAAVNAATLPKDIQEKRDEILDKITSRVVELTGGQMMHLFKGETASVLQAPNAGQASADYAKGHAKAVANGIGISYELGTGDFAGINFSAGQMSLGVYEHSANIKRRLYVHKFARLVYRAWLDEAIDKGTVPLLGGVDYWRNKERYAKCEFTGVKRVHADPVKHANQNKINLNSGVMSRTRIANENGTDIDTITNERAQEARTIVAAIESVASEQGIELDDASKLKILTDVIATNHVEAPEIIVEQQNDD